MGCTDGKWALHKLSVSERWVLLCCCVFYLIEGAAHVLYGDSPVTSKKVLFINQSTKDGCNG